MFSSLSQRMSAQQFCVMVALLCFFAALGFCFAVIAATNNATHTKADRSLQPQWDPSRFLVNAFLAPALEQDAVPLRWFDPRPALHCGPNTTVHVNGKPLVVGTAVPIQPFEVAWQVHDCRPFGIDGPRFNGGLTLQVYREDWGFSAGIVPAALRFTWPDGETREVQVRSASMPLFPQADDPD